MDQRTADRLSDHLIPIPFFLAMAWLGFGFGVPVRAFIFGSGSWGIAVMLKMILYHAIVRRMPHEGPGLTRTALVNGLFSGLTELGLAWACFAFLGRLRLAEVIAFGVGIGTIEAIVASGTDALKGTAVERQAAELERTVESLTGQRRFVYRRLIGHLERWIAGLIHVGTRGLIYVACRTGSPVPAALALAVFVLADGAIGYRMLAAGALNDLRALNRSYVQLGLLALASVAAFSAYWIAWAH